MMCIEKRFPDMLFSAWRRTMSFRTVSFLVFEVAVGPQKPTQSSCDARIWWMFWEHSINKPVYCFVYRVFGGCFGKPFEGSARHLLVHPHQPRHAGGLVRLLNRHAVGLHDGSVVFLVRFAQLQAWLL